MNDIRKGGDTLALSTDIHVITAEINAYQRVAGEAIFEIGRRLKHVKENDLAHGEWSNWCESINIPTSTARKFIAVAQEIDSKRSTSNTLGLDALYLIATLPPEEREKEHTLKSGATKTPDEMTVRELREVKKALKEAEERAQQAEQNYEGIRQAFESLEEQEPEVHYVEVERDNPELEQRLKMYEEKFGDIRNYTDRHTATNTQEVTTSVLSFAKAVRDLAKRHAYLLQYQHVIPLLDHLSRDEYNEAVKALGELSKDFKTAGTGSSVIDAEYEEVTYG
jgi:DNA repair exonuclease SbcCD ATPase subunit